jgi:hypothetical protein
MNDIFSPFSNPVAVKDTPYMIFNGIVWPFSNIEICFQIKNLLFILTGDCRIDNNKNIFKSSRTPHDAAQFIATDFRHDDICEEDIGCKGFQHNHRL